MQRLALWRRIVAARSVVIMRFVDLQLSLSSKFCLLSCLSLCWDRRLQIVKLRITAQYAYFARTAYGAAAARHKDPSRLRRRDAFHRIVFRHLLPNSLPPLIVVATVQIANAIALRRRFRSWASLPISERFAWHADRTASEYAR